MTAMVDKILTAEPFGDGTALTVTGVEGTRPGQDRNWKNLFFGSNIAPNGTPAVNGKPAFSFTVAVDQFLRPDEAGVPAGENYYGNCGWGYWTADGVYRAIHSMEWGQSSGATQYVQGYYCFTQLAFYEPTMTTKIMDWNFKSMTVTMGQGVKFLHQSPGQPIISSVRGDGAPGSVVVLAMDQFNRAQFTTGTVTVVSEGTKPGQSVIASTPRPNNWVGHEVQGAGVAGAHLFAFNHVMNGDKGVSGFVQNNRNAQFGGARMGVRALYGNADCDTAFEWRNYGTGGTAAVYTAGIDQSAKVWKLSASGTLGTEDRICVSDKHVGVLLPFKPRAYDFAALPPATDAGEGALVYVADRDTFAASDGANWRVVAMLGDVLQ